LLQDDGDIRLGMMAISLTHHRKSSFFFSTFLYLEEGSEKRFVHSTSFLREKQARATLQRSGAMLVPRETIRDEQKSVILLVREKLHFVFSLVKITKFQF